MSNTITNEAALERCKYFLETNSPGILSKEANTHPYILKYHTFYRRERTYHQVTLKTVPTCMQLAYNKLLTQIAGSIKNEQTKKKYKVTWVNNKTKATGEMGESKESMNKELLDSWCAAANKWSLKNEWNITYEVKLVEEPH